MSKDIQADSEELSKFLLTLLSKRLDASASDWLTQKLNLLRDQSQTKDLFITFSTIPRFLGKNPLELSSDERSRATEIRPGFSLDNWTVTQAARVLTLCVFPFRDQDSYLQILNQLFNAAEVSELSLIHI